MNKNNKEHEIDLKSWFFKFKSKWYMFAVFAVISLAAAYVFIKSSERLYEFKSTLLLGNQHTGSKKAQELLDILAVENKGIKVEDEIGLISSADMVKKAIKKLNLTVAYFHVKDHWLNTFFDIVIEEQYDDAPYEVKVDTTSTQLVDVEFEVQIVSDDEYKLKIKQKEVPRYSFREHTTLGYLAELDFAKTLQFGKPYKDENISFTLFRHKKNKLKPGKKYYFVINSLESLVGQYQSSLAIKPIERESRVLELSSKGSIPEKEILFLNTLMEEYVANDLNEKNSNGLKTLQFIDDQLATLSDSLRQSKQALSSFRSSNRITNINTQSNINYEKLSQLEIEKSKLNTDRQIYAAILNEIENNDGSYEAVSPTAAGIQNPILSNLFLKLQELNQQKAGYSVSATKDNPKLQKIEGEIKSTRNTIIANLKNLVGSAEVSSRNVDSRINNLESTLAKVPENERKLLDLQGDADFVNKKYDFLLEKRAEAAIALATNTTDKKIVDRATLSSRGPVNVKPKMIYMLALIIGLIIPATLIVLIDNVDNTIQGKNDLSAITKIPFLGVIAHGTKADKLAVKNNSRSAISESFRSIRINLQYLLSDSGFKVIGITSSISGEGKTFTSVNLSSEFAVSGKRTILIEADLRKPTLGKYFNLHNSVGLSSYLEQDLPLSEVIQPSGIQNLDVISCGPIPESAIKLLELPKMNELIAKLRQTYDYIIIDTPPIGYVSEYFILKRNMDTNIYVVKHKYTNKDMLAQINELYASKKVKNIYTVINDLNYSNSYEYGYKKKANYYYV